MKSGRASLRDHKARGSTATVSIHVRAVAQMFNSLDPSPFWDRDLDRDAAQFIEGEFSDKLSADIWHLHVYAQEGVSLAAHLQAALETYYERLATSERRALREHFWMAQLALLGGVLIFLISMGARRLAYSAWGVLPIALDEGLIILAWLALWRPAEALLYEWVPLHRRRRLYERLAGIRVSVLPYSKAPGSDARDSPAAGVQPETSREH
ncbi:MAG: hypothetical protein JSR66_00140 [Proteobacteria bacterium]|nr:hypothetical protein [Pseudomonadota bacterium]